MLAAQLMLEQVLHRKPLFVPLHDPDRNWFAAQLMLEHVEHTGTADDAHVSVDPTWFAIYVRITW